MIKVVCVLLSLVAANINTVDAISDDELAVFREAMKPLFAECGPKYNVGEAELKAAQQSLSIEGLNTCFMACVLKKVEILNSEGKFDADKNVGLFTQIFKNPEDKVKYTTISKTCTSVNDKPVTDGNAGCDRAKLLLTCEFQNGFDKSLLTTVSF